MPEMPHEVYTTLMNEAFGEVLRCHREVLTCRFLLGLSVRETAVRMGVTEGNVKTMQFRALKRAADLEYSVN